MCKNAGIAFENGCPHRKRLEDWYARGGEMPERTIELGSYRSMLAGVAAGMGVALLPKSVLSTFSARSQLSVHALSSDESWAAIVLIRRKSATSPKLEALRRLLCDTCQAANKKKQKVRRTVNVRCRPCGTGDHDL